MVASDGGVFIFGDAPYEGSLGGQGVNNVVGMTPTTVPLFAGGIVSAASIGPRTSSILAAMTSGRLTPDRAIKAR